MKNYWDKHGRLHDSPVTATDEYPSNNSFLFSGEASLVGVPVDKMSVSQCYVLCCTEYGFNRNPDFDIFPASSHDEVVGMFMLWDKMHYPEMSYETLKRQHFQVCNLPGFKPTPLYKLNPLKVVRDLWRLSREENPRRATPNYPYIMPVTFRHAPQHTYFYKRCAGLRPGLLHSAFSFFAGLHTVYRGSNSSRVLLAFKLLKFKTLGLNFFEKLLLKAYNKKLEFGTEVSMYFPDDHPIKLAVGDRKL